MENSIVLNRVEYHYAQLFYRSSKTVSEDPPRHISMAVLVVGAPTVKKQEKTPRAILPKSIKKNLQAINDMQPQIVRILEESSGPGSSGPVRQHTGIQTEIYGVENLAIEGSDCQTTNTGNIASKTSRTQTKLSPKMTREKMSSDKRQSIIRKRKSSTGMQTSVSLFQRDKIKTVTGTQTSGDYILKKAMASAELPIQRKTVASQVSPQKPNPKRTGQKRTCSSETQTGASPEKKTKETALHSSVKEVTFEKVGESHIDTESIEMSTHHQSSSLATQFNSHDKLSLQKHMNTSSHQDEQAQMTDDSSSTSTQTLSSYLENLKNNTHISFPQGIRLKIASGINDKYNRPENEHHIGSSVGASVIVENLGEHVQEGVKDSVTNSETSVEDSSHVKSDTNNKSKRSKRSLKVVVDTSDLQNGDIKDITNAIEKAVNVTLSKYNKKESHISTESFEMSTHHQSSSFATQFSSHDNLALQKHTNTSLHQDEQVTSNISSKPHTLISTTSGITLVNNTLTYSDSGTIHEERAVSVGNIETLHSNDSSKKGDDGSNKLYNPVNDVLLCGKTIETINTIDMGAQTMSATEFEQLLLASGLFTGTSKPQTDQEIQYLGQFKPPAISSIETIDCGQNMEPVHKEMESIGLSASDFDFLNENSTTTDMNTQTVSDFNRPFGPQDTDTQTVADMDFLDLVMTNMETQTLSNKDLIDLGLMDPNEAFAESVDIQTDDLKTSETQTSFSNLQTQENKSPDVQNSISKISVTVSEKLQNVKTFDCDPLNKVSDGEQNHLNDQWKSSETNTNTASALQEDIPDTQAKTQSKENNQSTDFITMNTETQTAFDQLEKLLLQ